MPYAAAGGAANQLFAPTTAAGAWGMEVVLTFALVYLVLSSTDSERAVDTPHLPVRAREWPPRRMLSLSEHGYQTERSLACGTMQVWHAPNWVYMHCF